MTVRGNAKRAGGKLRRGVAGLAGIALAFALAGPACADDEKTPAVSARPPGAVLQYVPPAPSKRMPGGRIGGGTRGPSACEAEVAALAPEDHAGLTLHVQPRLQWYLSRATDCRIDFVLTDPMALDPILETTLAGPFEAGIHTVSLADHGVELEPGREYGWFISIVGDPKRRDRDVSTGGTVVRVAPSEELRGSLAAAEDEASVYAANGIWHDALADLSARIEGAPADARLREQRAAMLEQVGLGEVASRERAR